MDSTGDDYISWFWEIARRTLRRLATSLLGRNPTNQANRHQELDSSMWSDTEGILLVFSLAKDRLLGQRTLSPWAVNRCRQ